MKCECGTEATQEAETCDEVKKKMVRSRISEECEVTERHAGLQAHHEL